MFDTAREAAEHIENELNSDTSRTGPYSIKDSQWWYEQHRLEDGDWQDFEIRLVAPDPRGNPCHEHLQPTSNLVLEATSGVSLIRDSGKPVQSGRAGTRIVVHAGYDEAKLSFLLEVRFNKERRRKTGVRKGQREIHVTKGQRLVVHGPAAFARSHCTCGHEGCVQEHRLSSWDPTLTSGGRLVRLWDFIANAVRGPFTGAVAGGGQPARLGHMTVGTLIQGMIVPKMISTPDFGRTPLRLVNVEKDEGSGRRGLEARLFVRDVLHDNYKRELRVVCKARVRGRTCDNLLPIPSDDRIDGQCLCNNPDCPHGGKLFFAEYLSDDFERVSLNARIRYEKARQVDHERLRVCDAGAQKLCGLKAAVWCTVCADARDDEQGNSTLSQRPTTVWVPEAPGDDQGDGF